ncbi:glycosyl transferase [uncultured Desulfosarcina sp.]|uniref:glycosyl transferase n=1 Tax=uncultured Desulfosarcina sp. TaxID=218289 RepID=UPI0029C6B7BC|nr:glycosyl transferase [uncultured Desulfosarcina sp.]
METNLLLGAAAFLISLTMTPVVRLIAIRNGWVARPREDRWHKKTTALMGGIAIFLGISVPLWMVGGVDSIWRKFIDAGHGTVLPSVAAVILVGATILFFIGLADDFINLKPQSKLIGQIIVASMVTFLGFRLNWFTSLTLDTIFTLVWIVGITNAFNLLDNMDGLCAGVAMVSSLSMSALYFSMDPVALAVAVIISGACAAFLVYNFKPASIFMGDCGSLVIGFAIAVLSLYHSEIDPQNRLSIVCVPVLLLMVPLLDTSLVTTIRLLSGRKASTGGRDHTSHRLVLMGLSETHAVLFLYGIGTVSGVAAVFVSQSDSLTSPAVIIPIVLAIGLMGIYLAQLRVYPDKEFSLLRGRIFTPVLIELTYKRQMMMVILDVGLVAFAYYLSYRLRFDGSDFTRYFRVFLKSLPIIIPIKLIVFYLSGIYKGFWQYISTRDVFQYIRCSALATLVVITAATILYRFTDFSKGVFVIDYLLTTVFLLGTRGSFRLFTETMKRKTLTGDPVVIYGAGQGGELLLREILNNKTLNINPVGFLDDDPLKIGKKIQGYPILGNLEHLSELRNKNTIRGVILSFSDNSDTKAYREAIRYCRENGLFLRKFSIQLDPVELFKNI